MREKQSPSKNAALYRLIALCAAALAVTAGALLGSSLCVVLSVPIMLYVALFHLNNGGVFLRNLRGLHRMQVNSEDGEGDASLPGVSLIVPARDEEETIEIAARSLAALDYPNLEIIILNDHSEDATGEILDRLAKEFPQLRVVHDPPEQEGWLGKANALWQGVQVSDASNPYLLFTDADVVHHPKSLRRAMPYMVREDFDYLTCVPWLDSRTLSEELTLSTGWCAIVSSATPERINEPDSTPVGVGPFALLKRQSYVESGGHSAIYNIAPEDKNLARTLKEWGGNMGVTWSNDLLSFRLYRGYKHVRRVLVRKIRIMRKDRVAQFVAAIALTLLSEVIPIVLAVMLINNQLLRKDFSLGDSILAMAALSAFCARMANYRAYRHLVRISPGTPLLHPIGGLLHCWFSLSAILQIRSGKRMEWRGRKM